MAPVLGTIENVDTWIYYNLAGINHDRVPGLGTRGIPSIVAVRGPDSMAVQLDPINHVVVVMGMSWSNGFGGIEVQNSSAPGEKPNSDNFGNYYSDALLPDEWTRWAEVPPPTSIPHLPYAAPIPVLQPAIDGHTMTQGSVLAFMVDPPSEMATSGRLGGASTYQVGQRFD